MNSSLIEENSDEAVYIGDTEDGQAQQYEYPHKSGTRITILRGYARTLPKPRIGQVGRLYRMKDGQVFWSNHEPDIAFRRETDQLARYFQAWQDKSGPIQDVHQQYQRLGELLRAFEITS